MNPNENLITVMGQKVQMLYALSEVIDTGWFCTQKTVAVSSSIEVLKSKLEHTALALNPQILPHAEPEVTELNVGNPEEYEYKWVLDDGDGEYLAYTITSAPLLNTCESVPDFEKQWKERTQHGLQNAERDLTQA